MKRLSLTAAVTIVSAVGASCETAAVRGPIVIASGTDIGTLLPVAETGALDGEVNAQLYLSLNSARWENGRLDYRVDELSLSERWDFSPDSTVLIYYLREDAVWSDGQPIDAGDVVFTFELVRRPDIASVYIDVWEHLDSVVAMNDHQVAFHFRGRYPGMLFDTGLGIIPSHIYAPAASDAATLTSHPSLVDPGGKLVVSGPYRIAEWRRGERLVLESNPNAFTTSAATDTVIIRILGEETTRLVELENGNIDVLTPLPLARAGELSSDARFRIEVIADRFYDYIAWNPTAFPTFGDPEVRRALSLAIDRQAILTGLGVDRYARPAAGPYPAIFGELADPELQPDAHQPDSARAILAARGWRDDDGDGVLDREGQRFSFTLLTQADNARRTSAAEIIQAHLAEVGVEMAVRALEFNTLLSRIFEERDFQAVLLGWQVGLEPDYLVGHFWPADHPFNVTGYASTALDSLIPLATAAATAEQAAPYWRAAARVIADDRPYAFLWFFDDPVVVAERVKGTRIDTYGLLQNLHEWRVEP